MNESSFSKFILVIILLLVLISFILLLFTIYLKANGTGGFIPRA